MYVTSLKKWKRNEIEYSYPYSEYFWIRDAWPSYSKYSPPIIDFGAVQIKITLKFHYQTNNSTTPFSLDQTQYSLDTYTLLMLITFYWLKHLLRGLITFSWLSTCLWTIHLLFGLITFSWLKPFSCMSALWVSVLRQTPFMHVCLVRHDA